MTSRARDIMLFAIRRISAGRVDSDPTADDHVALTAFLGEHPSERDRDVFQATWHGYVQGRLSGRAAALHALDEPLNSGDGSYRP